MFRSIADNRQKDSLATSMRKKRFAFFLTLLNRLEDPITILDVGGTEAFWKSMELPEERNVNITILNISDYQPADSAFSYIKGDACDLRFKNEEFDIIFSNSVIEHVGGIDKQRIMAKEVMRVGKRYFVQTPNKGFPLEPHFLFPFFQFLPKNAKIWLVMHFNLGWFKRQAKYQDALSIVNSVSLLSISEFKSLFPNSKIIKENLFGLTKSFTVYGGWNQLED